MRRVLTCFLTVLMLMQCLLLCSCTRNYEGYYAREVIQYIETNMPSSVRCVYSQYSENRTTVSIKFVNVNSIAKISRIITLYNNYMDANPKYFMNDSDKSVSIEFYADDDKVASKKIANCSSTYSSHIDYLDLYTSDKSYSYKFSELDNMFPSIRYLCLGNKYYADDYTVFYNMYRLETIVIEDGRDISAFDLRDDLRELYPRLNLYC
ncbi:MAG: hypothetical protein MJ172_04870 [Clostridia bacterium]|nr:hypothetical protein [Clostridia bacterium]